MKTLPNNLADFPGASSAVAKSCLPVALAEVRAQYTSPVVTFDAASDAVVFWDGERGLWWPLAAICAILVLRSEDHVDLSIDEIKGLAVCKLLAAPIHNDQGIDFLRVAAGACSKFLNCPLKDLTKNAQPGGTAHLTFSKPR
jgi:hypothetical protein